LNRLIALLAALMAVALIAAGCGSSDDSTTDSTASLTKAEFLKQGNAVCAAGNKKLEAGFESFAKENNLKENKKPTDAQFEELAETVLVPGVQGQIDGLRALGTPEGDEGELDELLTSAEEVVEEVEEEPLLIAEENGEEPFATVNQEASAYGLTTCGEENE
jgi:hypothetical protein